MVERSSTVGDRPCMTVLVDVHLAFMEVHDWNRCMSELQCMFVVFSASFVISTLKLVSFFADKTLDTAFCCFSLVRSYMRRHSKERCPVRSLTL